MAKQKMTQPEPEPTADPEIPLAPGDPPVTDEEGFTYEVKSLGEEPVSPTVPAEPAAAPNPEPGLMPERCQFCGHTNMIDIRRSYYCINCAQETSK